MVDTYQVYYVVTWVRCGHFCPTVLFSVAVNRLADELMIMGNRATLFIRRLRERGGHGTFLVRYRRSP